MLPRLLCSASDTQRQLSRELKVAGIISHGISDQKRSGYSSDVVSSTHS